MIANVPVVIQLFQDGQPGQKFDVKLDATGHAIVANIPLTGALEPVVLLDHAGLTQQTIGATLEPTNPQAKIVMSIYEMANEAPAWNIAMRHVIVHSIPEGLQVTEMLSVKNPTDRIWLGSTQNAVEHVTLALPLAAGLTNLELGGGFQEPYAKVEGEKLVSTMPMFPGAMEFQINYIVPVKNGAAKWTIVAPATVDQLIVFAPADQSTVTVDGAKDGGTMDMGQGPMHMFRGAGIKAGQVVTLSFTGLASVAATSPAAAAPGNWARNIGAIGAGVVILLGSALLLVRRPAAKA